MNSPSDRSKRRASVGNGSLRFCPVEAGRRNDGRSKRSPASPARWRAGGGAPVVVIWGPPERADARAIVERAGGDAVLAPGASIREMAALLGRAALFVSTDCFARHVAIAQDVPTVGVFGPTDPRDWTPPTGPHRTVGGPGSAFHGETSRVPMEAVREVALDLWSSLERSAPERALDAPRAAS